jgi:type II secretory pathway predicted ATPase ExeA
MTKTATVPAVATGKPTDLRAVFGFHAIPFTREIATDHHLRLPFLDEAFTGLLSAVENRMSAALIAPAGTGKTALLRRLRDALPEARYHVHYVKVTGLSKRDMCREIAIACGAQPAGSYPMLVRRLQERFEATAHQEGRRPALLLDESHELRPDVLGMLRILTNFDMDSRLVLSLVIAGQPPLRALLARDEQEAMARRISHYAQLRLLSRDELAQYVAHRCAVAGTARVPFDDRSLDAIFEIGRGNLRATDDLALKSLDHAAAAGHAAVSVQHVVGARKDLWP